MSTDLLRYERMVERALRGVVVEALRQVAEYGLPGAHYLYITFKTQLPGVALPDYLHEKFPEEMTIVLQHQFWDLTVEEDRFLVTLSFNDVHQRLVIPFAAVTAFADPSVNFGLQLQYESGGEIELGAPAARAPAGAETATAADPVEPAAGDEPEVDEKGNVVPLDAFRKK